MGKGRGDKDKFTIFGENLEILFSSQLLICLRKIPGTNRHSEIVLMSAVLTAVLYQSLTWQVLPLRGSQTGHAACRRGSTGPPGVIQRAACRGASERVSSFGGRSLPGLRERLHELHARR